MAEVKSVNLQNLLLSLDNPRYGTTANQNQALRTMVQRQGRKLTKLAQDIVENGLNPTELVMVTPTDQPERYIVVEGNRRVAAMKLLSSPDLINSLGLAKATAKRYMDLQAEAAGALPGEVPCAVVAPEDATHWMVIKHTGENEGVGVIPWSTLAKDRYRKSNPALQAVELVDKHGYLTKEMKAELPNIALTNVSRFLGTPDARRTIGVDWKDETLVVDSEESVGRLAMLVQDVLNRTINVTRLEKREDRISFAQELLGRTLPEKAPQDQSPKSTQNGTGSKGQPASAKRAALVPKNLKLSISQTRIAKIYDELRRLNVSQFTNAAAVLLRVFVEMSVDEYASQKGIDLKDKRGRDLQLRNKLLKVAQYLEDNKLRTKHQLQGIRAVAQQQGHVLSVDSWNAYVHNQHYSPGPSDLISNWDSIQSFVEELWRL